MTPPVEEATDLNPLTLLDRDSDNTNLHEQSNRISSSDEAQSDTESDTSDSDKDSIFPDDVTPERRKPNIITVRDNFTTRKDNLVIFTTQMGEPCDEGARMLLQENKNLKAKHNTLGRARVVQQKNRRIIILTIKENSAQNTDFEIIKESLHLLVDVAMELDLNIISMCQSNVAEYTWLEIRRYLCRVFSDSGIKIIVCTNQIRIPPPEQRQTILKEYHCAAAGGHKGITKTYNRIKTYYTWPRMKREIEKFVNQCRDCQLKKLVRVKPRQPMILTDTPDAAFDKVSMDIMGPLPESSSGNAYVLTIQDLLTKYSLAIPLKNASAICVADAFVSKFICIHGAPKALLTDQGTHFINSLMRAIARKFRITQYKTSAYRPQSNGSIERSHHVLWEYLKQYTNKTNWDELLPLATFSYNTSVHEGTRHTPHELVFGRLARVPTSDPTPHDCDDESYTKYLTQLFYRIRDAQETARRNLNFAKERSKRYYDKRAKQRSFKIGDKVYLLKEPQKGKLGDQYRGPYEIIKLLKSNNVQLDLGNKKTRIVHTDKLKVAKT